MPPRPRSLDLTAVLVRAAEHDADSVRRAVAAGGYGDVWLRVHTLAAVGLLQVELLEAGGLPRIDPGLVMALAEGTRRALFVHVNHEARQAVVHAFEAGSQIEGWVGEPSELDGKLRPLLGHDLAAVVDADDGTRAGIGVAASDTDAIVRGRRLVAPVGMPTMLGTLAFHDAGEELGSGDRVCLVAFDAAAVDRAWRTVPGAELAARVRALPAHTVGPLAGAREAAAAALADAGDRSPAEAGLASVPAYEQVALADAYAFGGGGPVRYVDERFLPLFSLSSSPPAFDEDELEALDELPSVLAAMVEVLPFASPGEGAGLLEQIAPGELLPLAPWARAGDEYVGTIFRFDAERVRTLLSTVDQRDFAARVDAFYRAWWREQGGDAQGFEPWRQQRDELGSPDIGRFLRTWADWRAALELGRANALQPALLFYGG